MLLLIMSDHYTRALPNCFRVLIWLCDVSINLLHPPFPLGHRALHVFVCESVCLAAPPGSTPMSTCLRFRAEVQKTSRGPPLSLFCLSAIVSATLSAGGIAAVGS